MPFADRPPSSRVRRRARRRAVFTILTIVVAILIASGAVMVLGRW
jgi:hypothetical protein